MSGENNRLFRARVLKNRKLSSTTHLITYERPEGFIDAYPGQFVSIRVNDTAVPLLRRPFGIMDLTDTELIILVKIMGPGSRILTTARPGDEMDVAGPLGGVPFSRPAGADTVFVAGGTGLAPIIFCSRMWKQEGVIGDAHLFLGASTEEELLSGLYDDDFTAVHTATIDGSSGFTGNVVELLEKELDEENVPSGILYSCGPRSMIMALIDRVNNRFDTHYTSLEAVMACGIGACRGCTVPVKKDGETVPRPVCSDGTVFRVEDIDWEEWES